MKSYKSYSVMIWLKKNKEFYHRCKNMSINWKNQFLSKVKLKKILEKVNFLEKKTVYLTINCILIKFSLNQFLNFIEYNAMLDRLNSFDRTKQSVIR